jgi:hypothetical protein
MKVTKEQLKTFGKKVLKYGYLPVDIYTSYVGIKKNGEIDSISFFS